MNRQQQDVIEYLRTENQVLKEKVGNGRILLNDDQRRRLAVKGKVLGRKCLEEAGTLLTSNTIRLEPDRAIVTFYTYTAQPGGNKDGEIERERIIRHSDTYRRGKYRSMTAYASQIRKRTPELCTARQRKLGIQKISRPCP
jgi:predicted GNAT family N-acyltransferase